MTHEYFMNQAILQAKIALEENEVPIGAIMVCQQTIIAKAYNNIEKLKDVTAHAEILAITQAASHLGAKYLNNCTLYVTLEPCLMCAGALYWTQIATVIYGASDPKRGFNHLCNHALHPKTQCFGNILATESSALISNFFKNKR